MWISIKGPAVYLFNHILMNTLENFIIEHTFRQVIHLFDETRLVSVQYKNDYLRSNRNTTSKPWQKFLLVDKKNFALLILDL